MKYIILIHYALYILLGPQLLGCNKTDNIGSHDILWTTEHRFVKIPESWDISVLSTQYIKLPVLPWKNTCRCNWDGPIEAYDVERQNLNEITRLVDDYTNIINVVENAEDIDHFVFFTQKHKSDEDTIQYSNSNAFTNLSKLMANYLLTQKDESSCIDKHINFVKLCKSYSEGRGAGALAIKSGLLGTHIMHLNLVELIGKSSDRKILRKLQIDFRSIEPDLHKYKLSMLRLYEIASFYNGTNKISADKELIKNIDALVLNEGNIKNVSRSTFSMIGFPLVVKAQNRLLQLEVAMRLYFLDKGHLPEKLSSLTPDYTQDIPIDPFSGRELRYDFKRCLIWSIGTDLKDSSGDSEFQESLSFSEPTIKLIWGAKPN